jgi:hypothetical protein
MGCILSRHADLLPINLRNQNNRERSGVGLDRIQKHNNPAAVLEENRPLTLRHMAETMPEVCPVNQHGCVSTQPCEIQAVNPRQFDRCAQLIRAVCLVAAATYLAKPRFPDSAVAKKLVTRHKPPVTGRNAPRTPRSLRASVRDLKSCCIQKVPRLLRGLRGIYPLATYQRTPSSAPRSP